MANNGDMKLHEWTAAERGRIGTLAANLQIKPPTVSDWCTRKKCIPVARAAQIEFWTGGEVTRQDMFPEKWQEYWPELAKAAPAQEV